MKQFVFAWAAILSFILAGRIAAAANAGAGTATPPTDYEVIERGANHRVWQRTTYETLPDGSIIPHLHQYTELASGLHYLNASGQWVEAQEQIEAYPQGAIARQGQFQAIFADNLNTPGAIDVQTADGNRLRSTILGLMYVDPATGDAVTIARLQDSEGQLISANQVLYTNAFEGVLADVRYTYKKSGLEQDVILHQQPPAPEVFGMNSQTVELVAFTEFIEPAAAWVAQNPATGDDEEAGEEIGWGAVHLGNGKAFLLNGQDAPVKVIKQYKELQGRYFLLEKVRLNAIQASLAELPEQAARTTPRPNVMLAKNWVLPKATGARAKTGPMRLAQGQKPTGGYVLDYVTVSGGFTNFTFQGDTTYYVSGTLSLYGTNTFEGGTVIKYATNGAIQITPGPGTSPGVNWGGSAYRPVILTAKDDNSVGESFGSGTPAGYYGNPMLLISGFSPQTALVGSRFLYAKTGITLSGGGSANLYSAQFVQCQNGISLAGGTAFVGNGLFASTKTNLVFTGGGGVVNAQNVTFSGSTWLAAAPGIQEGNYLALTNCDLVNVTNLVTGVLAATNGNNNGFYQSPYLALLAPVWFTNLNQPFQPVGAGGYYLATNSPWHNVGTTNLDPYLLASLANKTTYPPLVYSNATFSIATNFNPQAYRDYAGNPDLGYHYDPLDYVFGGVSVYSNLTFSAGCAVGWFNGGSGVARGISLQGTAQASFQGTATAPCVFARNNMVQEGGNGIWTVTSYLGGFTGQGGNTTPAIAPTINFLFTHCFCHNFDTELFRDYGDGTLLVTKANHSEFYCGSAAGYAMYFDFTNCLNFRAGLGVNCTCPGSVSFRNCTFIGGQLAGDRNGATWPVMVENCAFAATSFTYLDNPSGGNTNVTWINFNSYLTGDTRPAGQGSQYLTITNYNWESSWFGNYYLPTNSPLILAGSTPANLLGLYHFTTQTNQTVEGNAVVDIGYHYVATDQYGNPLDTNGDGIPDYLEDKNGNGIYDSGDPGNWLISPFNGLSGTNGLQTFTPLK